MSAIAHGWNPPASSGIHIPLAVALEFHQADKAKEMRNRRRAGKLQGALYRGPERRKAY